MFRLIPKKKSSASISPRADGFLLAILLAAAPTPNDSYYDLIYDFETASFCGLVSKGVYDAFWAKRRKFETQTVRDTEELRQTRIQAMANAEREYDNRGLGGHKQWCRGEVTDGIDRILK